MHVTLKVEPAQKPEERFEYGGFFSRKVYVRKPKRVVHQVLATVHFEDNERDVLERANLNDFVLWQGPERSVLTDRDLKWNLKIFQDSPRYSGTPYVDLIPFEAQVDPDFRHLLYQPVVVRDTVRISQLTSGAEVLVCECDTVAEANSAEDKFREALVILKKAITLNDRPASRVTTFEL